MKQSRRMSRLDAFLNVAPGYGMAIVEQMLIVTGFGLPPTLGQNLKIGLIFTIVSNPRSFALRRLLERLRTKAAP